MSGFYGQSVWVTCEEPGCDTGTQADARQVANLTASGGWYCHRHDDEPDTPGGTS